MAKYFIQDTTLTNIADAIREKTNMTSTLFPENMPAYIRSIQTTESDTTGIPDDIVTEAERVASSILSKQKSNSLTFIAMSDMHEFGDGDHTDTTIIERYGRANRNAGQAAKLISDSLSLDFFTNLGDFAWGARTTTVAGGVQSIRQAREYIADVVSDNVSFLTPGNHDTLTYGYDANNGEYLSAGVMEGLIGTYQYKDFDARKVRVICLNTAEIDGASVTASGGTERMTGTQLQWFCEALDLSSKSDVADWGIVILAHHPLDWGNIKVAGNALAAYLDGASYSVTHEGVAVSYNFSGKNSAKIIAQFHGHVHGFRVDYINDLRSGTAVATTVNRVAIPNACYARTNEYGENTGVDSNGLEFGEETSYEKTDDSTGNNTAFCVVTIDLDEEVIYADCFGAGYDRVISYGSDEVITYSITNNLTGANTSNSTTTIVRGESYSATISAYVSYSLNSVIVTMGGTDITSTVYSDGNISIPHVTGDVIITATAVAEDEFVYGEFTNVVLTSEERDSTDVYNSIGYKNDTYPSETNDGSASGIVCTGWIPYTWSADNVLYIKGATLDTSNDYVRIYGFNTKTYINSSVGYTSGSRIAERFTIEQLGDMYYKLTPIEANGADMVTYIRISLVGTGDNLIVTINEQIHSDGTTPAAYSVTNNLTNITTSNTASTTSTVLPYSATLTANDGYSISSVVVTMGGTDVTSTAYSNGTITISNVTGNIVITAVATASSSDSGDNLIASVGYTDGVRLSGSTGAEKSATGYTTTGFIDISEYTYPMTIQASGADFRMYAADGGSTYHDCYLVWYTPSQTFITATALTTTAICEHCNADISFDSEGNVTIVVPSKPNFTTLQYIKLCGYGSGANLSITINGGDASAQFGITNNLTNCSTSNAATTINTGEAYSATITADDGCLISDVNITMGGTDITETAYGEGGVITISEVTGNIVITITASSASTPNYTNQVPISMDYDGDGVFNSVGYMNNYYATTNAPYYGADTQGCCVTGIIPYDSNNPQTIYIKGVGFTTSQSHNRIGFFKDLVCKTTKTVADLATYFTITELGTNYYSLVPITSSAMIRWGYDGGISISAYGDGANMIVTLDEPIE